ncbi:hypothetical protein K438DRAFT_1836690, partial [Mycena galopus ATCC 62051]
MRSFSKHDRLHTLSIMATVSPDVFPCLHARTSPIAILDTFTGDCNDAMAPGWLRWLHLSVDFRQDRTTFIGVFVNLALWDDNLAVLHLSTAMFKWAGVISVGTWAQSRRLDPSTPRKRTTPHNFKPVRPCPRHNIYSASESPVWRDSCIIDYDYDSDC